MFDEPGEPQFPRAGHEPISSLPRLQYQSLQPLNQRSPWPVRCRLHHCDWRLHQQCSQGSFCPRCNDSHRQHGKNPGQIIVQQSFKIPLDLAIVWTHSSVDGTILSGLYQFLHPSNNQRLPSPHLISSGVFPIDWGHPPYCPDRITPMESINLMDGILGAVALLILGVGLFMLVSSMFDLGGRL